MFIKYFKHECILLKNIFLFKKNFFLGATG